MLPTPLRVMGRFLLMLTCLAARVSAQCNDQGWITAGSIPGAGPGPVNAMTWWDPDGPGPITRKVVIAGDFTAIGNQPIDHVALYDPDADTWSQLGPPGAITGTVNAMVILPNNHILLGGQMKLGATPVILAEWNGTAWGAFVDQNVVAGTIVGASIVRQLSVLPSGHIVMYGSIWSGSSSYGRVCRWSGTSWVFEGSITSVLGSSIGAVELATTSDGSILVGTLTSRFTPQECTINHAFGSVAGGAWNAFTSFGNVLSFCDAYGDTGVSSIVPRSDGSIIIAGDFQYPTTPGGTNRTEATIARIVGNSITMIANYGFMEIPGTLNDGTMIVTRRPLSGGNSTLNLLTDNTLTPIGTPLFGSVKCALELPGGDLLFGGNFDVAGPTPSWNLARLRRGDNSWRPINSGTIGSVKTFALAMNGDLYIGGDFTTIDGFASRGIVQRGQNGGWNTLDGGIAADHYRFYTSFLRPSVLSIATSPNGRVYVGGNQRGAGGQVRKGISIWNGTNWLETATIPPVPYWSFWPHSITTVQSIAITERGIIMGGFDSGTYGDGWSPNALLLDNTNTWRMAACQTTSGICSWQLGNHIVCMALTRGRTLLGGDSGVKIWSGTSWLPNSTTEPTPMNVRAAAILPDGNPIVFSNAYCNGCIPSGFYDYVWRHDGISWRVYCDPVLNNPNNTSVYDPCSLAARSNGEVIVGGKGFLKRWTGTQWQPLANNIDGTVYALQILPDGDLAVGGDFATIDGVVRPAFAIYRFGCGTCPADLGAQGGVLGHDGVLDNNDFIAFVERFFAGDPAADLGSAGGLPGSDQSFDNNDFIVFINQFFTGCT